MKVHLRFPIYSHLDKVTSAWWASLMYQMGWADSVDEGQILPGIVISSAELHWSTAGPAQARNEIVEEFLKTDATHLWMIDSDIQPPKRLDLLSIARDMNVKVLSGVYYGYSDMGGIRSYPCIYNKAGALSWSSIAAVPEGLPNLRHYDASGAGCLLVHREVLEGIKYPWFEYGITEGGALIGEAFMFFNKTHGVTVLTTYLCEHFKVAPVSAIG